MESLLSPLERLGPLLPLILIGGIAWAALATYRAQRAAKPGVKPSWGVPLWSETLPLEIAARLALVSVPVQMQGRTSLDGALVTELLPDADELIVKVVASSGRLRAPYVATVNTRTTPMRIRYRMDGGFLTGYAVLPLIAFRAFGESWVLWVFTGWLLIILGLNVFNVRRVVLPQLRQWAEGSSSQPVGVQL